MQIHHSKWIVSGSLLSSDVEIVFRPGGNLEFIERDEHLGDHNPWRRIDNQVEFSVCNPVTRVKHTHFSGRIYGDVIKGTCYKIGGESGSFEAVLVQSDVDFLASRPLMPGALNISFFLAHGWHLN